MTYCGRQLTDGFIPDGQVRKLADLENPFELAAKLVDVGLWERVDGGYRIHDWHDYNPSAAQVKQERAENARRQAEWRERNRRHNGTFRNGVSEGITSNVSDNRPVPVPVPDNTKSNVAIASSPLKAVKARLKELNASGDVITKLGDAFGEATGCDVGAIAASLRQKWAPALIEMHDNGLTPEDIKTCVSWVCSDKWWTPDKITTPAKLNEFVPKWIKQGKPTTRAPTNTSQPIQYSPADQARFAHIDAEMKKRGITRPGQHSE